MDKSRFFIPEKIKVGYQKRSGTYTEKLGYIIYYDKKGILRKEKSWDSWRDKSIPENEFPNDPIDGLILNKHTGGYKSDWNYRQSYCRIYDPRGFEFEITVDNLLFILDHTDCLKGKGLIGKFKYSWIGTEMVLLPENSDEYKLSEEASIKLFSKILKAEDLIPGSLYKVDNMPYQCSKDYREIKNALFVGQVKFQKNLGKGFESKLLFYDQPRGFVYTLPISSILYETYGNCISEDEIDNVLYLFSITAYSYSFWNTNNIVEELKDNQDDIIEKIYKKINLYSLYHPITRYLSEIIDPKGVVKLYRKFSMYENTGSSYYSYYSLLKDTIYHNYTLDFTGDIPSVIKNIELGKEKDHGYTRRFISLEESYPEADKKDLGKVVDNYKKEWENTKRGKLYYITKDNYISDSLQILLEKGDMGKIGKGVMGNSEIMLLPIKLEKNGKTD